MKKLPLLSLAILFSSFLYAQPFTLKEEIKPVKLNFYKFNPPGQPKAKGQLNVTKITQVKDTMYFFANQLSIYSPVYVGVTTTDKNDALDIRLSKQNWNNADRSGSTGISGHWEDKFKTENDFGIMVIAKNKPVTYSLVVWNGTEVNFQLPSVFSNDPGAAEKNTDNSKTDTGGKKGFVQEYLLYIIIALLVIIIAMMYFRMKKK